MSEREAQDDVDPRTPGRRGTLRSSVARADLLRRLRGLGVGDEALPRVLRLVEAEVERAVEARSAEAFSAEEVAAVTDDDQVVARLRERRDDARRVETIRRLGLHTLDVAELEQVLAAARAGRS